MVVLDFETRSWVDIRSRGASLYCSDDSTDVLCLSWSRNGKDVQTWDFRLNPDQKPPEELVELIRDRVPFVAHNAFFERMIWYHVCHKRYGWPDVPADLWRCTAAVASYYCLPRSLAGAADALGLAIRKDKKGKQLINTHCIPQADGTFNEDDAGLDDLIDYCETDVRTQFELAKTLGQLPPGELEVWQLDQRLNLRGLPVDVESVGHAQQVIDQCRGRAEEQIRELTDGQVDGPTKRADIIKFCASKGLELKSIAKETVESVLKDGDAHPDALQLLRLRLMAGKSSVAKLDKLVERVEPDGRLRDTLKYHGASTGRWSGQGVQIHNLPRGTVKQDMIDVHHHWLPRRCADSLDLLAEPFELISSSLRSYFMAHGDDNFFVGDFSQIEARVLAWLAGQDDVLELFRNGEPIYETMASKIYEVPVADVTKEQRQVGKSAVLGLGFGMGWRGFRNNCARNGMNVSKRLARRVVKVYRTENDHVTAWRYALEEASVECMDTGQPVKCGPVTFDQHDRWLRIKLPSGRFLHYYDPRVEEVENEWTKGHSCVLSLKPDQFRECEDWLDSMDCDFRPKPREGWMTVQRIPLSVDPGKFANVAELKGFRFHVDVKPNPAIVNRRVTSMTFKERKWQRQFLSNLRLIENITQAVARDFLVHSMFELEDAGFRVVATIHDEVVAEGSPDRQLSLFNKLLESVPEWGIGCPIAADGFITKRYRKD